ncbi:MAG: flagellar basal body L-ring protein FlgH [Planctomycetota bacterium]
MRNTLLACLALVALAADAVAQRRVGSIYDPNSGAGIALTDKTAARVGDLVTVIIQETQNVKNEEKAGQSKSSSLNYQLLDFNLQPNSFSTLPSLETSKADSFSGSANVEKKGTFTARLTAMVIDTLPNGNLVIQGRRELRVDGDVKLIEFSGVVRRYDVTRSNTIESELVADARISYVGQGPGRRATERRGLAKWLHNVVDWLWPF